MTIVTATRRATGVRASRPRLPAVVTGTRRSSRAREDPLLTLAGDRAATPFVAHTRLGQGPGGGGVAGIQDRNRLDTRPGDPASAAHVEDQVTQDRRPLSTTLAFRRPLRL